MDLAYVDKLAKDNNGVKYLLVRQNLFDRTVDAKTMKSKDSEETVRAFLSMITKKSCPKNIWVDKGTEFAEKCKKMTHFFTKLNSRRNCSKDLIPKNVNNSDFLSILYSKPSKPLRDFRTPKF